MAFLFFFFCNVFFYMWLRWVWQGHWWAFISEDMGVHACAKPGKENKSFSLLLQHLCSGGSDGTLSSRFLTAGKEVFLLPSSAALTLACQVPREGGVAVRRIC